MRRSFRTFLALIFLLAPAAAWADATSGEVVARRWCANCHVVGTGARPSAPVPQGPPSFKEVAGRLNSDQIRTFLTRPHGAMPDLALTRAEIDDLVAYIGTLR